MSIADGTGQPIESGRVRHDALTNLANHYRVDPKKREMVEQRFDALLAWLQPHAEYLNALMAGRAELDATTAEGQILVQRVVDLACTSLLMKAMTEIDVQEEDAKVRENGGTKLETGDEPA